MQPDRKRKSTKEIYKKLMKMQSIQEKEITIWKVSTSTLIKLKMLARSKILLLLISQAKKFMLQNKIVKNTNHLNRNRSAKRVLLLTFLCTPNKNSKMFTNKLDLRTRLNVKTSRNILIWLRKMSIISETK